MCLKISYNVEEGQSERLSKKITRYYRGPVAPWSAHSFQKRAVVGPNALRYFSLILDIIKSVSHTQLKFVIKNV